MTGTIQVILSGDLPNVDMDLAPYVKYCKNIERTAEEIIISIPEFSQKRKGINVALSMATTNGKAIHIDGKTIEMVIETDIREIIKEKTDREEIRRILIEAAINAVKKKLPKIQASPEPIPDPVRKKKWWELW